MSRRPFATVVVRDFDLNRVQQNVNAAFSDLSQAPELNAQLISLDVQPGSDFTVNHQLGRVPQEYQVVRKSAPCDVWESQKSKSPQLTLILQASAAATITLKVQ